MPNALLFYSFRKILKRIGIVEHIMGMSMTQLPEGFFPNVLILMRVVFEMSTHIVYRRLLYFLFW